MKADEFHPPVQLSRRSGTLVAQSVLHPEGRQGLKGGRAAVPCCWAALDRSRIAAPQVRTGVHAGPRQSAPFFYPVT